MRLYVWKFNLIITALVALTFASTLVQAGNAITPSELLDRINIGEAPLILDVRTPEEFASGHISGAVNIPHRKLRYRLSELMSHQDREIVVYCWVGPRSRFVQSLLSQAGFEHLRELEGHMRQWQADGYPIE